MTKKRSLMLRWQYWFDNQFSKGTVALIKLLGLFSVILIIMMGSIITTFKIRPDLEPPLSFPEAAWRSMVRTLDAGTFGGDTGWEFRISMLIVTIGGVFIISTLIGILTNAVQSKLDTLRKGRSEVVEDDHTVILGWSNQVFLIISELIEAHSNHHDACIVVMSEIDKIEMEEEIFERIGDSRNTRIVCRNGCPMDFNDLTLVSLNTAKSIIILSPEIEDPDYEVIKTILAIVNHPDRRKTRYHITAEIIHPGNQKVADIVGKGEVTFIQEESFFAHMIAQTCRQSGLSSIYTELMNFSGDDIYIREIPELVGKFYKDILSHFRKNSVLGIARDGKAQLNPPSQTVIRSGDEIILIAENDARIVLDGKPELCDRVRRVEINPPKELLPEFTLILGWNQRAAEVVRELDQYVVPGSEVVVVANDPDAYKSHKEVLRGLRNEKVTFHKGEKAYCEILQDRNLTNCDHIIVLCSDKLDIRRADAQTLLMLLQLREIVEKGKTHFSIVSEMLDIRDRNLAEVTRADDFIVSGQLVSLMMAQVSERRELASVFEDLFNSDGSEIYLKPVERYFCLEGERDFYMVVEAVLEFGETAIGYRLQSEAQNPKANYGICLNPDKSTPIIFKKGDKLIVLAED